MQPSAFILRGSDSWHVYFGVTWTYLSVMCQSYNQSYSQAYRKVCPTEFRGAHSQVVITLVQYKHVQKSQGRGISRRCKDE